LDYLPNSFGKLRLVLASHRELTREMEQHDQQIAVLLEAVQKLLSSPDSFKKHHLVITAEDTDKASRG
jgi:hypothetical protein